MRPLRVAQVCRIAWPHLGGMESVVGGLAGALAARGHEVHVVSLDRAITDGRPLPEGEWRGVRYARVPRIGPRRYPFGRGLLRAIGSVDLIHVHGLDGLLDVLVRTHALHGARVGVSTHGGFLHTDRTRALKAAWLRTVTRSSLARADAVWFTSETDRERLAPARAAGEVMPDGVDVERFATIERRPEPGRWLVLGRVDVHKGHADLIEALGVLARVDDRPFLVDVIGPERVAGLTEGLQRRACELGIGDRVRFHGPVSDAGLREALARCECALFPSRYEGFGVAVVEAMAAGVPVVVSDIPAFDQLVTPGVDGWRVSFRRAEAAASGLLALRDRDVAAVADAARRSADRYSWDVVAARFERAYHAVCGT